MEQKTIYIFTAIVIAAVLAMVVVILLYFWRNKRNRRTSSGAKSTTKVESVEEVNEVEELFKRNPYPNKWSEEDYSALFKINDDISNKIFLNQPLSSKETSQWRSIEKFARRNDT